MKTILLIEDHNELREFLQEVLEEAGFSVVAARCPDDAFKVLRKDEGPDLIISDLEMPFTLGQRFMDFQYSYEVGIRTIEELRWVFPDVPLIAMTALPDAIVSEARRRLDSVPLLRKPFHHNTLVELALGMAETPEQYVVQ